MKKIGIMFATMLLLVSMFGVVSADEYINGEEMVEVPELELEDAGALPGDFFYGFDKFFDNMKMSMTFNPEKRIERSLNIADERLAEAEILAQEGRFERAEKARLQYEKFLGKAENNLERFETSEDFDKSEAKLRAISRSEVNFEKHKEILEERKSNVLDNLPENLTEENKAKIKEIFERIEDRLNQAEDRATQKKDNFFTSHRLLGDLSDEEAELLLEQINSEEGISAFRELRDERGEQRFTQAVNVREANLERWKDKLNEEGLTEEEILRIEEKISMEELKLEDFRGKFEIKAEMQEALDLCRENSHEKALECKDLEGEEMKTCLEKAREESQDCFEDIRDLYKAEFDFDFGDRELPEGFEDMIDCQKEIREEALLCEEKEGEDRDSCLKELKEKSVECTLKFREGFGGELILKNFTPRDGTFDKYQPGNNDYKARFKSKLKDMDNYPEYEEEFKYESFEDFE